MTLPLEAPRTTADALLLARALDRPAVRPGLERRYGEDLVANTANNVHTWVDYGFADRLEPHPSTLPVGCAAVAATRALEDEPTGAVPIDGPEPEVVKVGEVEARYGAPAIRTGARPFDVSQSKVVVSALLGMARRGDKPGARREVAYYLARNAPSRLQRFVSALALRAMVQMRGGLVHYNHAGITRGGDRTDRIAAAIAESRNQISTLYGGQKLS